MPKRLSHGAQSVSASPLQAQSLFFAVATILAFLWVFDKVARLLGYTRTEPTR